MAARGSLDIIAADESLMRIQEEGLSHYGFAEGSRSQIEGKFMRTEL
jgi:hypothetical protein